MNITRSAKLAAPALCAALSGCSVANPPGYARLSKAAPLRAAATPGVIYGAAPTHWTFADGRRVRIDVDRAHVSSGLGRRRVEIAFDIGWEGAAGQQRLRCRTDPAGPGLPQTRFGCWSVNDAGATARFWMAADPSCGSEDDAAAALTARRCWSGELATRQDRYALHFGHLEASDAVVNRISWSAQTGAVVLAADIVAEMNVELYAQARGAGPLDPILVLQTLALHWWTHAARAS